MTVTTPAPHAARAAGLILSLCFAAALCEGFDIQAAGVSAPGIAREFHAAPGALGWFFSSANLGLLIGAVIGGRLSDRLGRKPVLVASLGLFGLFSLATALASDMQSLTIIRLLTGLGLGGCMPNLIAVAAGARGEAPRGGDIAISYLGMPLGGAVASLVAVLVPSEHWRQVFMIGGVTPLATGAAIFALLPASPGRPQPSPKTAAEAGPSALSELFGGRLVQTVTLWVGVFLGVLTLHLMLNWLPLLLQAQGLSKSQAALSQIGFNVGGAAGALLIGKLMDTDSRKPAIVLNLIALPAVLLLLAAIHGPTAGGLAIVLGGSALALQVVLFAVAGSLYAERVRGTGLGVAVGVGRFGSIVGPALGAVLLASGGNSGQVLVGLFPIALAAGLCATVLAWPRAQTAELATH
ncbi:MAG TPA: MFS transporter [Phenylobacterium sp.]|jgi:AAHS family 3-hydroxyphenylpropionic acid transporter|nr:MFS transporter [Phenylobacterium sp.]